MSYLQKIEYRIVPEESFRVKHNCGGCGCKRSFVSTKRFRVNANGSRLDVWLIYQCEQCKHTLNVAIYERTGPDRIPKEEYLRFLANEEELAEEYGRNFALFKRNRLEVEQEAIAYRLESESEMPANRLEVEQEMIVYGLEPESGMLANRQEIEQEVLAYWVETAGEVPEIVHSKLVISEISDTFTSNADLPGVEGVSGEVQMLLHNPYGLKLRPEKLAAQVLGLSRSQVKRRLELGHIEILQKSDRIQIVVKEADAEPFAELASDERLAEDILGGWNGATFLSGGENSFYAYHVVTERPMQVEQRILFDDNHHSGVYSRVMAQLETVRDIYANPQKYEAVELEYPIKVALRELALEEVRKERYPQYPSRMSCLYASEHLEEAKRWADYFMSLGRPTFSIVKLRIMGRRFVGDATKCFEGTIDHEENLRQACLYWENAENSVDESPINELLVDGVMEVVEIVENLSGRIHC
ncbi:MAG: DUF2441 domain-containing protein [Lachnospiraceae bacterium]|nr:DUF2441 domain-containing protein [Lachnospiraceae bacterium]